MAAKNENEMHFCPRCGTPLERKEHTGKIRPICPLCNWIYFPDPKVAAATLVLKNRQVLLVRRAIDPYRGLWTLPAGFVDAGEDPAQAASRECLEETGLEVRINGLLDVIFGLEHERGANFVIFYQGEIVGEQEPHPYDDVDGAAFFSLDQLPPIAFLSTHKILAKIQQLF